MQFIDPKICCLGLQEAIKPRRICYDCKFVLVFLSSFVFPLFVGVQWGDVNRRCSHKIIILSLSYKIDSETAKQTIESILTTVERNARCVFCCARQKGDDGVDNPVVCCKSGQWCEVKRFNYEESSASRSTIARIDLRCFSSSRSWWENDMSK